MSLLSLFKRRYHPLNEITITQKNLVHNYHYLSTRSRRIKVAPVLKSNAYGHGIVAIAKILDRQHPPFFCVDSIYESYELLKAKIQTPILIMGYIQPENLTVKKLPFSYAVYTIETLEWIKKYQPDAGIHLFVDTGMHREGIPLNQLSKLVHKAKSLSLTIEGLMSHLAMADDPSDRNTQNQIKNFQNAQEILHTLKIQPKFIHLANSSGLLEQKVYLGKLGNIARTGISLFGIDPEGKDTNLKPVLQLSSTIAQIKDIQKDEKVGYDFTYTASGMTKIAILPIGYNDGVDRRLSNRGFVQVGNVPCPIIGRVSMNITTIDISAVSKAKIGDSVIIYSNLPNNKNSIFSCAKLCQTIPYELLIHLHPSTKRSVL